MLALSVDLRHDPGLVALQIYVDNVPLFSKPLIIPLPIALLMGVARVNEALSALLGRAPMLSRGKVREFTHSDWVCDNTAFSGTSGWRPAIRLAEGVARLFDSA